MHDKFHKVFGDEKAKFLRDEKTQLHFYDHRGCRDDYIQKASSKQFPQMKLETNEFEIRNLKTT